MLDQSSLLRAGVMARKWDAKRLLWGLSSPKAAKPADLSIGGPLSQHNITLGRTRQGYALSMYLVLEAAFRGVNNKMWGL